MPGPEIKGDTANIGLNRPQAKALRAAREQVTAARVARHFKGMIKGPVEQVRAAEPLRRLNFLLHGALDGGGTISLKTDAQGKVFSTRACSAWRSR